MQQEHNHFQSYGVFIVATMLQNILGEDNAFEDGTDVLWESSICLYEEFIKSEYNVDTKSEMDCIEDFLKTKY
jgi:hypothetical protein